MSSNENPAQTTISHDRDDAPDSAPEHAAAPAPEDVPRETAEPGGAAVDEKGIANIGVVGLAVMGSNLARNLASREGNNVAIHNRSYEKTETLLDRAPRGGVRALLQL